MTGDRGGGEVALGVALAAQVEVVIPSPKEATAVKVPLDPPDRMLQHLTHLAGLEVSKARKDQLVPLLGPSAVQRDRVQMWVQAQVGGAALIEGLRLRAPNAAPRRSLGDTPTALSSYGPASLVAVALCAAQLLTVYVAAGAGMLFNLRGEGRQRTKAAIALAVILIVYFVLLSAGPQAYSRFRVPMMPLLALCAAGSVELWRAGAREP